MNALEVCGVLLFTLGVAGAIGVIVTLLHKQLDACLAWYFRRWWLNIPACLAGGSLMVWLGR